jgi:hypothetical protein
MPRLLIVDTRCYFGKHVSVALTYDSPCFMAVITHCHCSAVRALATLDTCVVYNLLLSLVIPPELAGIELHCLYTQCGGLVGLSVRTTRQVQRNNQR